MKVFRYDDGVQIEAGEVLVTIRQHPDYGFKGSVVQKNAEGYMTEIEFHGDGLEGVVTHEEKPIGKDE